jgi:DNA-binding CsgD family transcriptional regulator
MALPIHIFRGEPVTATPYNLLRDKGDIRVKQMGRPGLSVGQKAELWQRWKSGQSLSEIGRTLGKHAGSVHTVLAAHGGIVPAIRKRSPRPLSLKEREEISRGLAAGESLRQIAATLKRSPSTISREVGRNSGKNVKERGKFARFPKKSVKTCHVLIAISMFLMHKKFVSTGITALNSGKNWKLFYSYKAADFFVIIKICS